MLDLSSTLFFKGKFQITSEQDTDLLWTLIYKIRGWMLPKWRRSGEQLPEDLKSQWGDYLKLQEKQGLPFGGCAGQTVRRFTYTVTNYPEVPDGVQANLFLCGDRLVGGDIIATGENGFQTVLAFPEK